MNSLYISTDYLYLETVRIQECIRSGSGPRSFATVDIDYESYCTHYHSLRDYVRNLPAGPMVQLIKEKMEELPDIQPDDFDIPSYGSPFLLSWILGLLSRRPYRSPYTKLEDLKEKLATAATKLGTIQMMLKAAIN